MGDSVLEHILLQCAKDILQQTFMTWLQKYTPDLVAKKGWNESEPGFLELYHEMFTLVFSTESSTLQLADGETKETFFDLLQKSRQVRNCATRPERSMAIPIDVLKMMFHDTVRLANMLGDERAAKELEMYHQRIMKEIAVNHEIKNGLDELNNLMSDMDEIEDEDKDYLAAKNEKYAVLRRVIEQKKQLEYLAYNGLMSTRR